MLSYEKFTSSIVHEKVGKLHDTNIDGVKSEVILLINVD